MTNIYMAQDASANGNEFGVTVVNAIETTVTVLSLFEIYQMAADGEICTASGWLQRHIQELKWKETNFQRSNDYVRSIILGAGKMDAIILVPISLVEYGLEAKLLDSEDVSQKESINDSLKRVREDIGNGGQYYCIDGQNRIFQSIVPFMQNKFCMPQPKTTLLVDGKEINIAFQTFQQFSPKIQQFFKSIDLLVVEGNRGEVDAFVEALIWKNDGVPWNSWMKILTYDWHTAYRKQLAMISESEGPIMDLLDRLGGQTYHHDFNGWELLTSELLYWMNHNRWPRNENDHRSQFKNITKKQDSYAKKLSKYVREFALGVSDKGTITHMELKNYVILRWAMDNRNRKIFKNEVTIPNVTIGLEKEFVRYFQVWHKIMKRDDKQDPKRWPDAYINSNNTTGKVKAPGSYLFANSENGPEFIRLRLELLIKRLDENMEDLLNKHVVVEDEKQPTIEQVYDFHKGKDILGREIELRSLKEYDASHRKSKKNLGSNKITNVGAEKLGSNRSYGSEDH